MHPQTPIASQANSLTAKKNRRLLETTLAIVHVPGVTVVYIIPDRFFQPTVLLSQVLPTVCTLLEGVAQEKELVDDNDCRGTWYADFHRLDLSKSIRDSCMLGVTRRPMKFCFTILFYH